MEAHAVISNTTTAIHCVTQSYAKLVTGRCVSQLQDAVTRNAAMLESEVVCFAADYQPQLTVGLFRSLGPV